MLAFQCPSKLGNGNCIVSSGVLVVRLLLAVGMVMVMVVMVGVVVRERVRLPTRVVLTTASTTTATVALVPRAGLIARRAVSRLVQIMLHINQRTTQSTLHVARIRKPAGA